MPTESLPKHTKVVEKNADNESKEGNTEIICTDETAEENKKSSYDHVENKKPSSVGSEMLEKSQHPEKCQEAEVATNSGRPKRSSKVTKRKSKTLEEQDTEVVAKRPTRVRKKRFSADFDYPLDKKLSRSRSDFSNQKQVDKKPATNNEEESKEPTNHSKGDSSENVGNQGRKLPSSQILPGKHCS